MTEVRIDMPKVRKESEVGEEGPKSRSQITEGLKSIRASYAFPPINNPPSYVSNGQTMTDEESENK